MSDYHENDEDRALDELKKKPRDEYSPRQPQYEDTALPEREYEDS